MGNTDIYQFTKQLSNIFFCIQSRTVVACCDASTERAELLATATDIGLRMLTDEMSHIIKGISDTLQRLTT